jgi:hypothetical protein
MVVSGSFLVLVLSIVATVRYVAGLRPARPSAPRTPGLCPRPQISGVPSMNKEMIISSGDHDTRVAILEDDQVVEIFIERETIARRGRQHLQGAGLQGPPRHAVVLH